MATATEGMDAERDAALGRRYLIRFEEDTLLQRGRDLAVVQARVIPAVAADDLELLGVAAFRAALHHAGRAAAQHHGPAMGELMLVSHAWLLSSVRAGTRVPVVPDPGRAISAAGTRSTTVPVWSITVASAAAKAARDTR